MKHLTARGIALIMSILLVIGAMPVTGFAAGSLELEEAIATQLDQRITSIHIQDYHIPATEDGIQSVFALLEYEMPEYFHVWPTGAYSTLGGEIYGFDVTYTMTEAEYAAAKAEFDAAAAKILDGLTALSDVEKALLVHDRLALWCEYDQDGLELGLLPTSHSYTAYGALVLRDAVCEGYSEAYKYMLGELGVECEIVTSNALGHEWNKVKLGGKWYHVDVTHDDPVYDRLGQVYHDHFLVSTAKLQTCVPGHDPSKGIDYDTTPADTTYESYYWSNVSSASQLLNGEIYYISADGKLMTDGGQTVADLELEQWLGLNYGSSGPLVAWGEHFARLYAYDGLLFYNDPDAIYSIDPTAVDPTPVEVYRPEHTYDNVGTGETYHIYGFYFDGNTFTTQIANSPNFGSAGVTVHLMEGTYTPANSDQDYIDAAKAAVDAFTMAPIAQEDAADIAAIEALIRAEAKDALEEYDVDVAVDAVVITTPAVAGNEEDEDGTNGLVTYTLTISKGSATPYEKADKTVEIIATAYTANPNQVAADAAADKVDLFAGSASVKHAEVPTQAAMEAWILAEAKKQITAGGITITADYQFELSGTYKAPITGTAGVPNGTSGSWSGDLFIYVGEGETEGMSSAGIYVPITAISYEETDQYAVDQAKAVVDPFEMSIAIPYGATEADIYSVIYSSVRSALTTAGVSDYTLNVTPTVTQEPVDGTIEDLDGTNGTVTYTITVSKNEVTYTTSEKTVALTAKPYTLTDEDYVNMALAAVEDFVATDIPAGVAEANIATYINNQLAGILAAAGLDSYGADIQSVTPAKNGDADDAVGIPGTATYVIKVSKGSVTKQTTAKTVTLLATDYDGKMNADILAEAKAVLETKTFIEAQKNLNTQEGVPGAFQDLVKTYIGNDAITFTINVTDFKPAVAGSAETSYKGEDGYAKFTITLNLSIQSTTTKEFEAKIIATEYTGGKLNQEIVDDAKAYVEGNPLTVAQADAKTEAAALAWLKVKLAELLVGSSGVDTIDVTVDQFNPAVAGSADIGSEGIPGLVEYTAVLKKGTKTATVIATVTITATRYDGPLNEGVVNSALDALKGYVLDVEQAVANNEAEAKTALEARIAEFLGNYDLDGATVTVLTFEEAVAGSADTTRQGTPGAITYNVTLTKGTKTASAENLPAEIRGTFYSGELNSDIVDNAKNAFESFVDDLQEDLVGSTQASVKAHLEDLFDFLAPDADSITLNVIDFEEPKAATAASDSKIGDNGSITYTVTVTKGSHTRTTASITRVIDAIDFDGKLDSEAVAEAKAIVDEYLKDLAFAQKDVNTEADLKTKIKNAILDLLNGYNATVDVTIANFQAAVAGSADTSHDGTTGGADVTVTVTVGSKSEKSEKAVTITATEYIGVLNKDVVDNAKAAIEAYEYNLRQNVAGTEEAEVLGHLETVIEGILEDFNLDESLVTVTYFEEPQAATAASASKIGEDGKVTFTVLVKKGTKTETATITDEPIDANDYSGKLDSEAIAEAQETVDDYLANTEFQQAQGNDADSIKARVEDELADALDELAPSSIVVDVTNVVPAEAGSADTSKDGKKGSAKIAVTVVIGSKTYTKTVDVTITATEYIGVLNKDVVKDAKAAIEAYEYNLRQNVAGTTQAEVEAHLETVIAGILADFDLDESTVTVTYFEAPQAATAASDTKLGVDGKVTFTVMVKKGSHTATAEITDEPIDANDYSGKLDSEAIAEAQETVDDYLANTEFQQAQGNDAGTIKTRVENELADALDELAPTSIVVDVTNVVPAEAGSADTSKDGKKGSAKIAVTVVIGSKTYTKTVDVTITATEYTGVLNKDVVDNAKAAIEAYEYNLRQNVAGTTQAEVLGHLETVIAGILADFDLDEHIVTVTDFEEPQAATAASASKIGKDGKVTFTVLVKKGTKTETAEIIDEPIDANDFSGKLDSEAIEEAQETVDDYLANTEFRQAQGNDADSIKTRVENELADALDELAPSSIVVDVTNVVPAEAGSASTTNAGESGSAKITVTVVIGSKTYTAEDVAVEITATRYEGILDKDAIKDAEETFDEIVKEGFEQAEDILSGEDFEESLLETLAEELAALNPESILVEVTEYVAPVAGSAGTSHEGTAGSAKVTIIVVIGSKTYESGVKTVSIAATPYTGVLDTEAVEDAEDKLDGAKVIVPIGADQDAIDEAIEDAIEAALKGDAEGVDYTVAKTSATTYTVTLTKGTESATVTITVEEEEPEELGVPADLAFKNGVATWREAAGAEGYIVRLYQGSKLIGQGETTDIFYDFSKMIEEDITYTFTVQAKGNGVTTVNSPESAQSAGYRKDSYDYLRVWQAYLQMLLNQKFTVIADAGEGGFITQEGKTFVKYGRSVTYKITAREGYEIENVLVDGKSVGAVSEYTFRNVKSNHTIAVTFAKTGWENPFTDISEKDDYYDAIRFVYENELFIGVSATRFAPDSTMTRAMFVTVLGRLAGVNPAKYAGTSFTDSVAGEWYAPYVQWAAEKGIVNGYGNGRFGVDDKITVEQAAVILARYADYVGLYRASSKSLDSYKDAGDVADWAAAQMKWVLEHGIYEADGKKLNPKAEAKRWLVAEMLYAFVDEFTD